MKVWMVLALLAMGLGCSDEPEQWSQQTRQDSMELCLLSVKLRDVDRGYKYLNPYGWLLADVLAERGATTGEWCRCALYEMERRYTESEFLLLSEEEVVDASGWSGFEPGAPFGPADSTNAMSVCWPKMFNRD